MPLSRHIPPQEQNHKWFRSHLLSQELELQEFYNLPQGELDLVMAETSEIRSAQLAQHFTREVEHFWHGAELGITPQLQRKRNRQTIRYGDGVSRSD